MRRTLILLGMALAVAALAAVYFALGAPGPSELFAMARGGPRVTPGFVGVAEFGRWRLICIPGPPSLDGLAASAAPGPHPGVKPASANACRINQEMPASGDNPAAAPEVQVPGQVIVAVNFSLVGPRRTPSAMLRLPPTARAGDVITLRFDDLSEVKTTVRDCDAKECLAAGTLVPDEWKHLSATNSLQITFPALARQWVILNLPVEGLPAAMDALNRTDISSVH
ncbi:MAG TPA: invasion associated locus B family protein [Micropepsaceae bacterium]|nr:invasion associated locus B family protein [Micropepsaceae bacterium]